MTRIYIPTYDRIGRQSTWGWIPEDRKKDTFLVCATEEEAEAHDMLGYNVIISPVELLPLKRQWLIDTHDVEAHGKFMIMLDDDLRFARRRDDEPSKFREMEKGGAEVEEMFQAWEEEGAHAPFTGIAPRQFANFNKEPRRRNSRLCETWGVDVEVTRAEGWRTDRATVMEDYDFELQVLTSGYDVPLINDFVFNPVLPSNAPGGVSSSLDREKAHQDTVRFMLREWPGLVTPVEKKAWAGMNSRWDLKIDWARAAKAGEYIRQYGA